MKELLYLKDDQLKEFIEKIFICYRETFSDTKKVLNKYSLGLAHQKVLQTISIYDGITISEILRKLKVTKQSLNRVLKDLIKLDAIKFDKDKHDTRVKHVHLSAKGQKIFEEIFLAQKKRVHKALLNSTSKEVLYFDNVIKKIINE
jgi:DNA-binding MarR family transcriptional regulator|tara:strand:- start:684 stop:1121 length:438 start_codon:yes stop_codon:yes gene_type:complete